MMEHASGYDQSLHQALCGHASAAKLLGSSLYLLLWRNSSRRVSEPSFSLALLIAITACVHLLLALVPLNRPFRSFAMYSVSFLLIALAAIAQAKDISHIRRASSTSYAAVGCYTDNVQGRALSNVNYENASSSRYRYVLPIFPR